MSPIEIVEITPRKIKIEEIPSDLRDSGESFIEAIEDHKELVRSRSKRSILQKAKDCIGSFFNK